MRNQKLIELYSRHKEEIFEIDLQPDNKIHGPFLIASSEAYEQSERKIAFVGQETRGWRCTYSIDDQIRKYQEFNYGEEYYASPFWNVIRKIEKSFGCRPYSSAWMNINRYDQGGRRPDSGNLKKLSSLDFLLVEEINMLRPDILIFFTGPAYDRRIRSMLDGSICSISGFLPRQFSEVKSSKYGGIILRTYHPNYLRRSGLENQIVGAIRQKWGMTATSQLLVENSDIEEF